MHINNIKAGVFFLACVTLSRCGSCGGLLRESAGQQHQLFNSSTSDSHLGPMDSRALFRISQQVANNLTVAQSLQDKYQSLKRQVSVNSGNNQDPTLAGIEGMKNALRSQSASYGGLAKFKSWAQAGE